MSTNITATIPAEEYRKLLDAATRLNILRARRLQSLSQLSHAFVEPEDYILGDDVVAAVQARALVLEDDGDPSPF